MSSKQLLYRFIESEHFNHNASLTVTYLSRYHDEIGIHHFLCSKLRRFSYEEIEFFLPQLCHLIVSIDNMESVALEEFIIELCERSAHGALLTFWLFQTHLHDLSSNPQTTAFKTCRRIYNKVQHIVFDDSVQPKRKEKIRENIFPVTLLASLVLGSIGLPMIAQFAGPLAISQAKKPRANNRTINDAPLMRLSRSKTVGHGTGSRSKRERGRKAENAEQMTVSSPGSPTRSKSPMSQSSPGPPKPERRSHDLSRQRSGKNTLGVPKRNLASTSLPDLRISRAATSPAVPTLRQPVPNGATEKRRPLTPTLSPTHRKINLLRSNYFSNQTQFLAALVNISNRLVSVPKPARLSALRAELALLNNDLPAEVDIPVICPTTVHDGEPSRTTHHRVVRINPAEATVLNSAERVPYLLMVEILRDDFDFDPETDENQRLLGAILSEGEHSRRRIFDLSEAPRAPPRASSSDSAPDSVFEPAKGDIGNSPIIDDYEMEPRRGSGSDASSITVTGNPHLPRLSSGATTLSTLSSVTTPRTSEKSGSRSGSPGPKKQQFSPRASDPQPDLSALATHMRTAAHMLAQLDASSSKRPRDEVAAIKAKIIASMQTLEEQSFFFEETTPIPTFDAIMANAAADAAASSIIASQNKDENDATITSNLNAQAGAARMENDQLTSGVERKADRDDPSAAMFGEEWTAKKERIRKSSPYGCCPNWDLLSVIVKTGADLRQEAFACQLIQVCTKIWEAAGVNVWTKKMRILVTGESSGLIETITNGTSLHSLKRSLTIATINSGKNPRGRIATLRDHFVKTFGEPSSDTYKAALEAFVRSLAAYSIICYVLQLKDRHNGNILLDNQGHTIHIDFGFMLSNSPGSLGFESAPFKLTYEYVDVMGGQNSESFELFRELCKKAFQALRKNADNLVDLVGMMGKESRMPCFSSGVNYATTQLKQRFQLQFSEAEAEVFVDEHLINKSLGSYYTRAYDAFQYRSQGIY